jgi:hypothetical protein
MGDLRRENILFRTFGFLALKDFYTFLDIYVLITQFN